MPGTPEMHSICCGKTVQGQKLFKDEFEWLQQQDIITHLGMDETVEWCNSFVLVSKPTGKVRLCLDPARPNQALIRLGHRGPILSDIFLKLNNTQYLSLLDVNSGYKNLKLDERSSYLTTFACQICSFRYKRLPFGAAQAGDMFLRKIDATFKDLPNVFGIMDDISVVGHSLE